MITIKDIFNYQADSRYSTSVAYFSMEFAIAQPFKNYCGGLGFLAGSHLRSAYQLRQNLIGVGILWKYGYYDQVRDSDASMHPAFIEKEYSFLKDTGVVFTVPIGDGLVHVKAYLLSSEVFGTAPLLLLSTDIPENDAISRTITHRLYDADENIRIAQSIILGTGGAMLLEILGINVDVYHMNEGHSVSLNFYLYSRYRSLEDVKQRVVFTTHTPELAGNEEHSFSILRDMSFFYSVAESEVRKLLHMEGHNFNYTLAALKFSRKANGVSRLHGEVARQMWKGHPGICKITSITNAQNKAYWKDEELEEGFRNNDDTVIVRRKKEMKQELFRKVADQCGKIFNENILTLVWARRFAGYKRANLLMHDWDRFMKLLNNKDHPVQIIWAGKPYPKDFRAIAMFNHISNRVKAFSNCAVLTGYELELSAFLKKGADVWLNTPRMYREASGTSGMTAAMNGAVNFSLPDGWIPEFAHDKENCFLIQPAPDHYSTHEKDRQEAINLADMLEHHILPIYYNQPEKWVQIMKKSAADVAPFFDSDRMAHEYYEKMYHPATSSLW